MGRLKGVPNKLTNEVKERLQGVMDNVVSTLDINSLDTNQKIKLLQIGLQYLLPKLQSHRVQDVNEDLPLWLEDAEIEVISRDKETDDWKSERIPIPKRGG
tara:strand:+ start:351 stop:653 length:303 start_codon:yes stop_codon:yes gene_type:complete